MNYGGNFGRQERALRHLPHTKILLAQEGPELPSPLLKSLKRRGSIRLSYWGKIFSTGSVKLQGELKSAVLRKDVIIILFF